MKDQDTLHRVEGQTQKLLGSGLPTLAERLFFRIILFFRF